MGRPKGSTSLRPAQTQAICELIELGTPFKYACEANNIPERTGQQWMSEGEKGIEPYAAFYLAVTRARALTVSGHLQLAREGGKGSAYAMWLLERRHSKDFGQKQKIEHSGPNEGPIETRDVSKMDDEELARLANGE